MDRSFDGQIIRTVGESDTFWGRVGQIALNIFAWLMGLLILGPVVLVLVAPFIS